MRIKDEQRHVSGHAGSCPPRRDCEPHPSLASSLHTPHESVHQEPSATIAPRRVVAKRDILIAD